MTKETRCIAATELRAQSPKDGKAGKIDGYAAVYNTLSQPLTIEESSGKRSTFRERIAPGTFRAAFAADSDVRALVNHDPGKLLGRTKSKTLRLKEDDKGLRFEVDVADTSVGRDATTDIERGDMDGCSFGFRTIKDEWKMEGGEMIRTLQEVELIDVGPVTFPAYDQTSVDVRSAQAAIAKLQPPAEVKKPTVDELRAKIRTQFDTELRALMEYDDKSLIYACRSAIQYFRLAFDYAQCVMDTSAAVIGDLTEQDRQAVDDCLGTISDLIAKARDCKGALQKLGAVDDGAAGAADAASGASSEMRRRVTETVQRGLEVPAELRAALNSAPANPAKAEPAKTDAAAAA